jgi:hypothetical protein
MPTYHEINQESIVLKHFSIMDSNNDQIQQDNINYFIENANDIMSLNLNPSVKSLIYHAISNDEVSKKNSIMLHLFSRLPFFLAFEKNEKVFFNMINYFNDNINNYFKSHIRSLSIHNEVKKDYSKIINTTGFEKVEALIEAAIFLPYQGKNILIAMEKQKLETLIAENHKETKKLKL